MSCDDNINLPQLAQPKLDTPQRFVLAQQRCQLGRAAGRGLLPGEGGADRPHDRPGLEILLLGEGFEHFKQPFVAPGFQVLQQR